MTDQPTTQPDLDSEADDRPGYESPSVTVVGSIEELTLLTTGPRDRS